MILMKINNKDNEESSFDENSEYNKCLNLNNDGMMGYISIPKIDVKTSNLSLY